MSEIYDVSLVKKISKCYLDYSKAVITDRALPDFRDGLKPVARRILFAMHELGINKNTPHKKCARIVGEVMGKFHPHGDCLRGNTKIYCLDGKFYEIKDLIGREKWVLSFDEKNKKVIPTKAHSFRIGQYTNKIYKITFSDGNFIETTSNHQLYHLYEKWKKAEDIVVGDMLMNGTLTKTPEFNLTLNYCNKKIINNDVFRIVGDFFIKNKSEIYHHVDLNHSNNLPDNIVSISRKKHNKIHKYNCKTAYDKGREILFTQFRNETKKKNSELIKLHNKFLFLIKAVKIVKMIIENNEDVNELTYEKYRIKIYNGTTIEKLYEYDYSLNDIILIAKSNEKFYNTDSAKGFIKNKKILKTKNINTVNWSNGQIIKNASIIVSECIKNFGFAFTFEQYEKLRIEKCKKNNLINNRNYPRIETLISKLNLNGINELIELVSNKNILIVKKVEILNVNNEPMYDFTVDNYQNMLMPIGKNKNDNHTLIVVHNSAIYGSLVRLAQDFSLLHPLIDGQGAFGSIDDDPAAMRYTEARLEKISELLLNDLEFNTVQFIDNFDSSQKEPMVLPAKFPNLLVNGTMGIAVGMATNIPPHNLNEVIDALIYLLENDDADSNDILKIIKGPDFPSGGYLSFEVNKNDFYSGNSKAILRGKIESLEVKRRQGLQITELPYQKSKEKILEQILKLIRNKKIEGILDVRDETDREGLSIVIEFSRNLNEKDVIDKLYKLTNLQDSVTMSFLALKNNKPKIFNLFEYLNDYLTFRKEITLKYFEYKLQQKKKQLNILKGYAKIIDDIENVIKIIRKCESNDEIVEKLKNKYDLNDEQIKHILEIKISRLSKIEQKNIHKDIDIIKDEIESINDILNSKKKLVSYLKKDFTEIKEKFGKKRQTKIV